MLGKYWFKSNYTNYTYKLNQMNRQDLIEILDFARYCNLMDRPVVEVAQQWLQYKIDEYESSNVEFILHTEWDN